MQELKVVPVGNVRVVLKTFRGTVVGASKGFSTEIRGWGDAADLRIWSTTTEHNQFFLKDASGRERDVQVLGELALRDGHDVSVIWGLRQGENGETCVAVVNHTMRKTTIRPHALDYLVGGKQKDTSRQGCLLVGVSIWAIVMGAAMILLALSTFAESGFGVFGLVLAAVGIGLVIFGWTLFRRPWKARDRRNAAYAKLEAEVGAAAATLAAAAS